MMKPISINTSQKLVHLYPEHNGEPTAADDRASLGGIARNGHPLAVSRGNFGPEAQLARDRVTVLMWKDLRTVTRDTLSNGVDSSERRVRHAHDLG
jgi:hypothetical protein